MISILVAISLVISGLYLIINFKHDIHMLQQNSYRIDRYWRWLKNSNMWNASEFIDMALLMLLMSTLMPSQIAAVIIAIVAAVKIVYTLRRKFKKPLVFTKRVWRIYGTAGTLATLGYIAAIIFGGGVDNPLIPLAVLLIMSGLS